MRKVLPVIICLLYAGTGLQEMLQGNWRQGVYALLACGINGVVLL